MSGAAQARVDWRQVRALTRAFLVMSMRTMPIRTIRGNSGKGSNSGAKSVALVVGIYTLFGFFLALMAAVKPDLLAFSFILHVFTMFVVGSSAMNEASEVLFTTSENDVLLHRPITPPTLVIAKGLTIATFSLLLAGALNLAPTLVFLTLADARPLAPLVHVFSVVMATVFASGLVICLYGVISRLLGRERFQRVITIVQISSTVLMVVGFQVVPRVLGPASGFDFAAFVHGSQYAMFLPPLWFAAIDVWLGSITGGEAYATFALIGIGVTMLCVWLGALRLPATGNHVGALMEEPRAEVKTPADVREGTGGIERALAWWFRDPVERATFTLVKTNLARDRQVKVRLASAFAMYLVFPLIPLIDPNTKMFALMSCWMIAVLPINALELLRVGSQPAAADVFAYAPIQRPASVFHGVRKAVMACVQLPLAVYVVIANALAARGDYALLLSGLPALLLVPPMSLLPGLLGEYVPFSIPSRTGQRAIQVVFVLCAMIPAVALAIGCYMAERAGYLLHAVVVTAVLAAIAHAVLSRMVAWRLQLPRRGAPNADAPWSSASAS